MKHKDSGVTLVALTVTIIVLAILVGISLNVVVGDNGLINRAKDVSEDADMVKAKEKLQLELANLSGDKISDKNYDEQGYIDNRLISKDMKVYEDYVVVDGWLFEIDRSEPKIKNDLGQGTVNENIQINADKQISGDYGEANIIVKVIYPKGTIKTIKVGGEEISFNNNGSGKFEGTKKVNTNKTYNIMAIDTKGNMQFGSITIKDLVSDLEIYNMEDMNKFKADLKSGKTYKGKNVNLMVNLDLGLKEGDSWEPLNGFEGNFYGNDFEINNLYINSNNENQGLFGVVKENSKIEEVIITSGKITGTNQGIGAIAGKCLGTISKCKNNITVNGGSNGTGGIAGLLSGDGKIEYSINSGEIVGLSHVGGICGLVSNGVIEFCGNTAKVSGSKRPGGIVGAVITWDTLGLVGGASVVRGCFNRGGIYGSTTQSVEVGIGGIAGYASSKEFTCEITSCVNYGDINATGWHGGGLIGAMDTVNLNNRN